MKAFRFPLDRALHIRRAQLEVEQAKLQILTRERERIELRVTGVIAESVAARQSLATQPLLTSGELSTMPDYQRGTKQLLQKLDLFKQDLLKKSLEQQRQTVEAERKVKLLEKLRGKRLTEWGSQAQKEQEDFAADAYLARWTVSS
jgi:flagellar export protein FliJ